MQLVNQLQSSLLGGENLFQASGYSDDFIDLEAQRKIAENIR
jgi:hypothetical protein